MLSHRHALQILQLRNNLCTSVEVVLDETMHKLSSVNVCEEL